ncbi:Crp/Fnr family transcriptional regulator [Flavihumibacter sp.]|jgi:CRP/FNR family transcriptional regulator|uniref:Crp/Fnr family transcriptional regulator n=1 Tax=Flavihumibacter sp. TaxID=1913981 RepID=UPI002FC919A8|nr:Crp/Fnr family transcriptional regulator [Flavihumibacter sediminis]
MIQHNTIRQVLPGFEPELYKEMFRYGQVNTQAAGTTFINMGDPIKSVILVLEGIVKLYQKDSEGNKFFMYSIHGGQACAISLVSDYHEELSSVMALAYTDTMTLTIPLELMDKWLMQYKSWHYFILRSYRDRYDDLLQTVNEIAFRNMDERLEFYIRRYVKQFGNQVKLTHQEISNDLNSSREVISRLLKKMEKNGWIIIHRSYFDWVK